MAKQGYTSKMNRTKAQECYSFGHIVPWTMVLLVALLLCVMPVIAVSLLPDNEELQDWWWGLVGVINASVLGLSLIGSFFYSGNYVVDVTKRLLLKPGFYFSRAHRDSKALNIMQITDVEIAHKKGQSLDERLFDDNDDYTVNSSSDISFVTVGGKGKLKGATKSRAYMVVHYAKGKSLYINTLDSKDAAKLGRMLLKLRYADEIMQIIKQHSR